MRRWYFETREKEVFEKSKMNKSSFVLSIVISTSSNEKRLCQVLKNVYPLLGKRPIELLLLVNKKTDAILHMISLFQDPNLKLIMYTEEKRQIQSIRDVAKGVYLLWTDEDVLPSKELVDGYLALISQDPSLDIAYGDLEYELEKYERSIILKQQDYSGASNLLLQSLLAGRGISLQGSITRKTLLENMDLSDDILVKSRFLYEVISTARIRKLNNATIRFRFPQKKLYFNSENEYGYDTGARLHCIKDTPLEILFPNLNWNSPKDALQYSLREIASGFMATGDFYNAERFFSLSDVRLFSVNAITQYATCLITIGNEKALTLFCESFGKWTKESEFEEGILSLIKKVETLEQYCMKSYQEKNQNDLRKYLRIYHSCIGKTFFSCTLNALRFKDRNNIPRACSAMIEAFMMQPDSSIVYDWLTEHLTFPQTKEYIGQLKERITGGAGKEPLYCLSTFKNEYLYSGKVTRSASSNEGFLEYGI